MLRSTPREFRVVTNYGASEPMSEDEAIEYAANGMRDSVDVEFCRLEERLIVSGVPYHWGRYEGGS